MNETVKVNCEIIAQNAQLADRIFSWDGHNSHAAFAAAMNDHMADAERLKKVKDIISNRNSGFSVLGSSTVRMAVAAELMKSHDPVETMEYIKTVYNKLKNVFSSGDHVGLAALVIYNLGPDVDYLIEKMHVIYKEINSKHWFRASRRDLTIIAFMAASSKTPEEIIKEADAIYENIKDHFTFAKSDALVISLLLAVYEDPFEWKCKGAIQIMKDLKESRIKFDSYGAASMLAPLAILSINNDNKVLASEIKSAEQFLSKQKVTGGFFGIGQNIRNMLSSLAVAKEYCDSNNALLIEKITVMACINATEANNDAAMITVTTM